MSNKKDQSKIWEEFGNFDHYNMSIPHNDRSKWLVEQLKAYEFSSVLEIGSCTGRNLHYIKNNFPDVKLSGIDVNPHVIEKRAKHKVPSANFRTMDVYDLDESEKYDLVFTMAVLIHIHPDGILDVISKCAKIANKYIIHIERNGDGYVRTGPEDLNPAIRVDKKLHWEPNIAGMYRKLGYDVTVSDVPEEFSANGTSHMVLVDLSKKL